MGGIKPGATLKAIHQLSVWTGRRRAAEPLVKRTVAAAADLPLFAFTASTVLSQL